MRLVMRSYSAGVGMNNLLVDFKAKDDFDARSKARELDAEYCVRTKGLHGSAKYTVYVNEEKFMKEPDWKKIVLHAMAEKTGLYFICGEGRVEEDKHYLPKYIHVCPAYGADVRSTVRYERVDTNES